MRDLLMFDEKQTVKALAVMEMLDCTAVTAEDIHARYKKLVKAYHPDVAPSAFKDGDKFLQIKEASQYLTDHLDAVNAWLAEVNPAPVQPAPKEEEPPAEAAGPDGEYSYFYKKASKPEEPEPVEEIPEAEPSGKTPQPISRILMWGIAAVCFFCYLLNIGRDAVFGLVYLLLGAVLIGIIWVVDRLIARVNEIDSEESGESDTSNE